MKAVRAMRLDGALEHAGQNFALIYAGGCLAIEADILPWTEQALFHAVETCFQAAVDDIRGHTNALGRGRAILKAKLRSDEVVQIPPGTAVIPEQCTGYCQVEGGIGPIRSTLRRFTTGLLAAHRRSLSCCGSMSKGILRRERQTKAVVPRLRNGPSAPAAGLVTGSLSRSGCAIHSLSAGSTTTD